jgi:hypothetical protein
MLPGDDRSEWEFSLLSDSRVTHLWDEEKLAGRFFAQSEDFYLPIAWDIYYLYGPDARWDDKPSPLVSWGYTIMGKRNQLREDVSSFRQLIIAKQRARPEDPQVMCPLHFLKG